MIPSISDVSLHPHLSSGTPARSSASAICIQAPPISTSDDACCVDIYPDDGLCPSCVPVLRRVPFKNLLPATRRIPIRSCPFANDARAWLAKGDYLPRGTGALPAFLSHSASAVIASRWERRPM